MLHGRRLNCPSRKSCFCWRSNHPFTGVRPAIFPLFALRHSTVIPPRASHFRPFSAIQNLTIITSVVVALLYIALHTVILRCRDIIRRGKQANKVTTLSSCQSTEVHPERANPAQLPNYVAAIQTTNDSEVQTCSPHYRIQSAASKRGEDSI